MLVHLIYHFLNLKYLIFQLIILSYFMLFLIFFSFTKKQIYVILLLVDELNFMLHLNFLLMQKDVNFLKILK